MSGKGRQEEACSSPDGYKAYRTRDVDGWKEPKWRKAQCRPPLRNRLGAPQEPSERGPCNAQDAPGHSSAPIGQFQHTSCAGGS